MVRFAYSLAIILQALASYACSDLTVGSSELAKSSGPTAAYYLEPEWASPGEMVIIHGAQFSEGMQLKIGDSSVSHEVLDAGQVAFVMPDTQAAGPVRIVLQREDMLLSDLSIWARPLTGSSEAFSELSASDVCQGVTYTTSNGESRTGEKICASIANDDDSPRTCSSTLRIGCITSEEFPALDKEVLRANPMFHASLSLSGVIGSIETCAEGDAACYIPPYSLIAQPLKAIDISPLVPEVIKQGSSLASVSGTLLPAPADCAADGATDCIAVADFPAIDRVSLSGQSHIIRNDLSIGGVAGTLPFCSDNGSNCFLPSFDGSTHKRKAIDYDSLNPSLIKSGVNISDITGTLLIAEPDCTADGQIGCLTTVAFPAAGAVAANTNKAKYDSSLTIAGIQGTLASCSSDGALGCTTVSSFPALDLGNWNSNKHLARSALSLASVSGSLGDCVGNGSHCYLPNYAAGTQTLKAISFDSLSAGIIKTGHTIAGINGTLLEAPANCSSGGNANCVATSPYPAVDRTLVDSNKAKIHTSLDLGGITGTLADCSADGDTSCLTATAFPAVDKALADANKAKVHSTLSLGGISGTMADCSTDAQTSCQAVTNYPAADKNAIDTQKSKVHATLTLAGVSGSLGSCGANGSDCYLPPYVAASQTRKAIDFDSLNANVIKLGSSISTVNGTVMEAPPNCTGDGGTACVTVANFPAMNQTAINAGKAKIQNTLTLGGVSGTAAACNSEGGVNCLTTAGFPSLDQAYLNSNKSGVLSTVSIAGISGTLASCTANASNCYLPSYSAGTQNLKAINYNDLSPSVIKLNQVISDVTGSMVEAPTACTADADSACTTTANFPAVNQTHIDTNKAKILPTLTVGGVTGTLGNCASDAATSCYTVAAFPAFDKVSVDAAKGSIRSSLTIGGIAGTLADCTANGSNCFVSTYAAATQPLKAINFDSLNSSIIKSGSSIAGVSGSVLEAPVNCSADAQTDCVAIANFPAVNKNTVDSNKAKMHTSLTAGGITGTMPNCTTDGETACLTTATFPAVQISNINSNVGKVLSTLTIGGVSGTMSSCAALGSACYIPPYVASSQPLKAIDFDSFTAGVIKNGTTLAGVTGNYPSSTSPMSTGDAFADFTSASFSTQIKSATTYGWFDREGTRHTHAGDADISAANIKTGVSIFGVAGTFTVPNSWDIRVGTSASTAISGKLKANCRNPSNLSYWDGSAGRLMTLTASTDLITYTAHGFTDGQTVRVGYTSAGTAGLIDVTTYYVRDATANTFRISETNGGTAMDITSDMVNYPVYRYGDGINGIGDSIDFYNGSITTAASGTPFGANYLCSGIDTTGTSNSVWKDVTTGSCSGVECRFKDQISQLEWTGRVATSFWTDAMRICKELTYDGKSDWRLPTQQEVVSAYQHGIYSATSANWITKSQIRETEHLWTATKKRSTSAHAWYANLANGENGSTSMSTSRNVHCVRKEGEDY